jgi:hypothetical protein
MVFHIFFPFINQIEFDVQGLLLCMLLLQAEMWIVA